MSLSFVFIDILALFRQKTSLNNQLSAPATPFPDGSDPDVWGLRCPEGTGQGARHNLAELRLRRIADVQRHRMYQPVSPCEGVRCQKPRSLALGHAFEHSISVRFSSFCNSHHLFSITYWLRSYYFSFFPGPGFPDFRDYCVFPHGTKLAHDNVSTK